MSAPFTFDDIIGYEDVKEEAKRLARTDENILIVGESGVGKRLFASAIHNESRRKGNPFIVVESPSFTHTLFESELFGHRKGAFTDAKEERAGMIESANGGTIFFDEVGDLPIELQPKILRVIEERKVRRIGENEERKVDVRFIFATNRDLWEEAKLRRFRDDLLHRIETFVLRIPPLRERKREEIEEIARGLWKRLIEADISKLGEKGLENRELNDEEMEILLEYHFPGNIRGLENILKRYKLKGSGQGIL
jgi:Transcriptional regulator containing GAF, AAA-type ATPase, and DNA binding domains